jgi:hypothetical protein
MSGLILQLTPKTIDCTTCRGKIRSGTWVSVLMSPKNKPLKKLCDTCAKNHTDSQVAQ